MAGAYAYGKTGAIVRYNGSVAKVGIRRKAREEWLALQPGTHEGYVEWERAEAIRKMVSDNVPTSRCHGAPKHGAALLAGLLRCQRCGRKLTVQYTGLKGNIPRYACIRGRMDYGEPSCIAFGGLRVDDAVEEALLAVVRPGAIKAAAAAEAQAAHRRDQARDAMLRDLEAARYAADRAFRQYDAADPENRLVAGELETRWNRALTRVGEIENASPITTRDRAVALILSQSPSPLSRMTSRPSGRRPTTDARLKKRIVRTVIREAIADLDDATAEIVLTIHWIGGAHTEQRLARRRRGQRNSTSADIVEAVSNARLIPRTTSLRAFSIATASRPGTAIAGPGSG